MQPLLHTRIYLAKQGLVKGFNVVGNLGFIRERPMTPPERLFTQLNLAGKVVFDAGAHIGLRTLYFSRMVGTDGSVVSFEPNPAAFASLRKNAERNHLANVKLFNVALGEKRELLPLLVPFGGACSALATLDESRLQAMLNHTWWPKFNRLAVEVYPLDECLSLFSLPPPDFVKIDVEGYEYKALLGMGEILGRFKPVLLIEVHGGGKGRRLANFVSIVTLLRSYAYEIREVRSGQLIDESNAGRIPGRHIICR